ncbi:MAG: hypothetical protein IKH54_06055 [Bacilli bacterium]|nr:hypothetical protein [Bacilli bacterium]
MKLKKKAKLIILLISIIVIVIIGFMIFKNIFGKKETEGARVINSIEDYGYTLKDNKDEKYKSMFDELKKVLEKDKVDYEKYAQIISEMFIYDFFSLDNKIAKNDIGGVDFIHPDALSNFLENAESTYYKYVESNIYGNRNQKLPMVDEVKVGEIKTTEFAVGDKNVDDAYEIEVEWTYTEEDFSDYQSSSKLVIVRDGKKLQIVELTK